jgi:hypothetical protein
MDPATRRLLFWLRAPFVADVALALIGVAYLLAGEPVGWWVLVFAAGRAVFGVAALLWIAPKLERRSAGGRGDAPDEGEDGG